MIKDLLDKTIVNMHMPYTTRWKFPFVEIWEFSNEGLPACVSGFGIEANLQKREGIKNQAISDFSKHL